LAREESVSVDHWREPPPGFSPFRRDVTWQTAAETPIRTLIEQLEFTKGNKNWGYQLRSGLAEISELDMLRIARAMGASLT
jgi:hypothetical protein